MSIKINTTPSTVTFYQATVPTALAGDSSNIVANSAHVRSFFIAIGKILNDGFTYVISSLKTITAMTFTGHTLTTGIQPFATTTGIGNISATGVNIASPTTPAGNLYIGGTQQFLLPAGTPGYSIPLVCNSTQCKIQAGVVTALDTGTNVTFPIPFASANPAVFACSVGATPKLITVYFPSALLTQNGFAVACEGGGDVNWVAIGVK
jgi:hypothetical protein